MPVYRARLMVAAYGTAGSQALAGDAPFMALEMVPDPLLDPFFEAVVQASEEAVVNVLAVSEEMAGAWGHVAPALDRQALTAALKRHGRYRAPGGRGAGDDDAG